MRMISCAIGGQYNKPTTYNEPRQRIVDNESFGFHEHLQDKNHGILEDQCGCR